MNTHVSFPIAKSVIQKGFEVKVRPMYYRAYKIDSGSYMYNTDGVLELCTMPLVGLKKGWIDAPTIAEVIMWLYEIHGIWIYCEITKDKFYVKAKKLKSSWRRVVSGIQDNENILYESPTEAYSFAIDYVLNHLI